MGAVSTLSDDWPHTSRLMPWLIAAFLAMIFLAPFDSIRLPVPMPVDSTPDRILLPVMAGVWLCGALSMQKVINPPPRTWISIAIFLFVVTAAASVFLNLAVLERAGDLQEGWKRLAVLLSYVIFFFLVATSLRKTELRAFGTLLVGLASLTALGTVVEYRTGYNVFYELSERLAVGGISVLSPVQAVAQSGAELTSHTRRVIGPTEHGLAVCTMMAFALPIAIIRMLNALGTRKIVWVVATGLILTGSIATLRKTGLVLPVAVVLVLFAYKPKSMLRVILPIGLALFLLIQVLAPSALSSVIQELSPTQVTTSSSTQGRVEDYGAVRPNVLNHPALGQGFGTYLHQKNRFIDSEYLKRGIETGTLGVVTYLFMVIAVMMVAHRSIGVGDPDRAGPALAASAGAMAYGVAGLLFDEFFFPQAPYLFFFVAAVVAVAAVPRVTSMRSRAHPADDLGAAIPSEA